MAVSTSAATTILFSDTKHDNWQSRLSQLIETRRDAPFVWGTHDCTLWAFAALEAVYGVDLGEPYRGRYTTPQGAVRVLKRIAKAENPAALMTRHLDAPKAIVFARKGDIVASDTLDVFGGNHGFGPVLGVCYGAVSFFVGEYELTAVPTNELEMCWHGFCR